MIFKKQNKIAPQCTKTTQQRSWKQRFKLQLYKRNYAKILGLTTNQLAKTDAANIAAENLIEDVRKSIEIFEQEDDENMHKIGHLYCSFIPLKKSLQFDDEIVNTFLYLRTLKESNNLSEQDHFYAEVRKFLKICKETDRLQEGWKICLKKFIVGLDVLKKIELFLEFQKLGSSCLEPLLKKYGKGVLKDIFMQSIMASNRYFERQTRLNKTWKISLQVHDKINEANISKTMKMLYCSICLIYDCGKHILEDHSHQKDCHYLNRKNQICKATHTFKAIQLLKELRDLENEDPESAPIYCSEHCFRNIDKDKYHEVESKKSKTISPMVESIIKMGVELFSYSPCMIQTLFPSKAPSMTKITCAVIFMYLIEQANLYSILNFKIHENEVQYLMKQPINNETHLPRTRQKNQITLKRKKHKKDNNQQDFKYQQIAICLHNYIGEEFFDAGCQNCVCNNRGFCLPQCQCGQKCPIMIRGCSCKSKEDCQSSKCPCYKAKTQCIPTICLGCFPSSTSIKRNQCKNDQILRGCSKLIRVGISNIDRAGFGAFAGQNIKKGSLVATYCGEVLDQEMQSIRETLKIGESFYNFACSEGSIDARFMGNKTRFINHGNESEGKTNLVSLNMFSQGQEYIGLYAERDIKEGEQLLFDYDGEGEVAKAYSNIYSFLRKQNKEYVKMERVQAQDE